MSREKKRREEIEAAAKKIADEALKPLRNAVKRARLTVQAQCPSCGGTGLYEGMCEARGYPVICCDCDGTGCQKITYMPYTGRKKKNGVKKVHFSDGKLLAAGAGASGEAFTYAEFEKYIKEPKH